eukprot:4029215-Pleurochrysis_carterae.AAC.6
MPSSKACQGGSRQSQKPPHETRTDEHAKASSPRVIPHGQHVNVGTGGSTHLRSSLNVSQDLPATCRTQPTTHNGLEASQQHHATTTRKPAVPVRSDASIKITCFKRSILALSFACRQKSTEQH